MKLGKTTAWHSANTWINFTAAAFQSLVPLNIDLEVHGVEVPLKHWLRHGKEIVATVIAALEQVTTKDFVDN